MVLITAERLEALCEAPHTRQEYLRRLATSFHTKLTDKGLTTLNRQAYFLAQVCYESGGFSRTEETLYYTHAARIVAVFPRLKNQASHLIKNPQALANAAYANRLGNGNEASGDGWRFRGRGLIQITGRENYTKAGEALHLPLTGNPDLAAQPDGATDIAVWFWNSRGCNALADAGDIDGITRRINGAAMQGAEARRNLSDKAIRIFSEQQQAMV